MQFDEKWSFVGKKQRHCDADDRGDDVRGDCWDHVAFDAEHRLVLSAEVGKRGMPLVMDLARDARRRLGGRTPRLFTSDAYKPYRTVIELVFAEPVRPTRSGDPRRRAAEQRKKQKQEQPLNYATVCKRVEAGRVVEVTREVVFGTEASVAAALRESAVSTVVNTSFIERHNATDRHRNARKARRTYRFSKDWEAHRLAGLFTLYSYNFCWCVRTMRTRKNEEDVWHDRTPAMAAGLADHVWTLHEWLTMPVGRTSN